MIVITGAVVARPETLAELTRLGVEHSTRSRAEPGCVAHNVHFDCENPLRLVFLEEWQDANAVRTHFARPESIAFVRRARGLAASSTAMAIYDAAPLDAKTL